jgi:hypothetical protein
MSYRDAARFPYCANLLCMIDPNSAPQIVQQVHPSWFDWITIAAIVAGPILALLAQRALDVIREKKKQRLQLYFTAMSWRGFWLHQDSVRALNSIDTIFDKKKDRPVRDAWAAVVRHANTRRPADPDAAGQQAWDQTFFDLRVDLYQILGRAVGYEHSVDYIKNQTYVPQGYGQAELDMLAIRRGFAQAITDRGLSVVVRQPND